MELKIPMWWNNQMHMIVRVAVCRSSFQITFKMRDNGFNGLRQPGHGLHPALGRGQVHAQEVGLLHGLDGVPEEALVRAVAQAQALEQGLEAHQAALAQLLQIGRAHV